MSYRQFLDVLLPLLSDASLQPQVIEMLRSLGASKAMLAVLNGAPKAKLSIMLAADVQVLTKVVAAMTEGSAREVLVPVLLEPKELLADTVVPLLSLVEEPRRMALVVNQVHLEVLLPLLRGVRARQLAAVLNGLSEASAAPSSTEHP